MDLIEQIRELKDKYNECIQTLNKSQEEIALLRQKFLRKTSYMSFPSKSYMAGSPVNLFDISKDDDELESSLIFQCKNKIFSPFMTLKQDVNNSSLAAEVFSNYNNTQQFLKISQSNDLIKKIKKKLIKTIPGSSNIESCFQLDDEYLNIDQFDEEKKKINCSTPYSIFSTGSSIYSNFCQSNSLLNADKIQIVKPIEGSITLKHWQNLATPNFGCLFENRPGISIKGNSSEIESDFKEDDRDSLLDDYDHESIDYYEISNKNLLAQNQNRTFSDSQLQLLTKILETEEIQTDIDSIELDIQEEMRNIFGILGTIFFKPIQNEKEFRGEFSDPDTPPSSPINLQNNSSFAKIMNKISSFFKITPTPPASPNNESVDEFENQKNEEKARFGFFDQIVRKLKEFNQKILKNEQINNEEMLEIQKNKSNINCITPPPSPSRYSPPSPNLEEQAYNEEDLKKSAFVTITKLNPFLNEQIDLSSLLRSLSYVKQKQRICI